MRPRHLILSITLPLGLLLACGGGTRSEYPPSPTHQARVDQLVHPILEGQWVKGLVVGLIGPNGTEVYGYGEARPGGLHPDGNTVFEIGSVTKTFTSLALSVAVGAGEISLDQPVQELLPPGMVTVPMRSGKAITLAELAAHTSGLPRMPGNFNPADPSNPYADFHAEDLYAFLNGYTLPVNPGTQYEYSNTGAGLLGHALSLKSGQSFTDLMHTRITGPLGMQDTGIFLSPDQANRLAQPHNGDLDPVPTWDFGVLEGAGALRSTVNDLLHYTAAQAGLKASPLASAMARTHSTRFRIDDHTSIGLAWFINDGRTYWHNGSTAGCESFTSFDPVNRTGVVVLSNTISCFLPATQLGLALQKMMSGQPANAVSLPPALELPQGTLDHYAGIFRFTAGTGETVDIRITHDGKALRADIPNLGSARLYATTETDFYLRATETPVFASFQTDASGAFNTLLIRQPDQPDVTATRVP